MPGGAPPPSVALRQLANGFMISQAVYVAAKLGIADLLREGPKSSTALAEATETHSLSLYRILRVLASVGVFAEGQDGRFHLTPMAECLQTGVPGSMRAYAVMRGEAWHWGPWGEVLHAVKTGETPFRHAHGASFFEYMVRHPDAAAVFDEAMAGRQDQENSGFVSAYSVEGIQTVVDVGGGNASLMISILEANPGARGILFDLPHVVSGAKQNLDTRGLAGRCRCVAGDFFKAVRDGADAYILSNVIHDWEDAPAAVILANCRRAMKPSAKLLLIETIVPPGNDPSVAKLIDFQMFVLTGGRERTEAEYRALLASAGFELARIIPTATTVAVIEAVPG